jgi:hypothetical protein
MQSNAADRVEWRQVAAIKQQVLRTTLPQNHHVEGVLRPKLIEGLVPMIRWIVALPLLAAGVSIGGGGALSAEPIAESAAGEFHAQRQLVQAPARRRKSAVLGSQHQLARKPKLPPHDPLLAALATARPTVGPALSDSEDQGILRPHSVNTMRVLASASSPTATPQAAPPSLERSQDEDRDLGNAVVSAGIHDSTKSSPIGLRSPAAPADLTTTS